MILFYRVATIISISSESANHRLNKSIICLVDKTSENGKKKCQLLQARGDAIKQSKPPNYSADYHMRHRKSPQLRSWNWKMFGIFP